MIKAKFRDHVRSKTPVAMVNEVLCKIICHNICVLIQESHELGHRCGISEVVKLVLLGKRLELAAREGLLEVHSDHKPFPSPI